MNAPVAMPEAALTANPEAEQALLGAIMVDNRAMEAVTGFLRPEHFADEVHAFVFGQMQALLAEGRTASPITLYPSLPAELPGLGATPIAYLAHLMAEAASVANARDYARAIHEAALRRELAVVGATMAAGGSLRDRLGEAETALIQLAEEAQRSDPASSAPAQDYDRVVADINARVMSGQRWVGARSGLIDLDARVGGFAPGDLIVIAGRPGMGKTALAVSMARSAARKDVGVGVDTLEMSEAQLRGRLLTDEAYDHGKRIAYDRLRKGDLSSDDMEAIYDAGQRLKSLPLAIIDSGNRLSDLPSHIRQARRTLAAQGRALDLFIIDYLGLVAPGDRYKGHKTAEVTEISNTLKALAKREKLPIVALHQLNRQSEGRDDHRPRLSELRDSGGLEQDADMVMFVHREAYYLERPGYGGAENDGDAMAKFDACRNTMEVVIAKNRHGPIGSVMLFTDMPMNVVRDRAR